MAASKAKIATITDLPLYLCPQFKTKNDAFVVVEWSGMTLNNTMTLRILGGTQSFTSIKECAQSIWAQPIVFDANWAIHFYAFSYRDFLPLLKFRTESAMDKFDAHVAQHRYPLQRLIRMLDATPMAYQFEPISEKHHLVAAIDAFTKKPPLTDWTKPESVRQYFQNIEARFRQDCKHDPSLTAIEAWKHQEHAGYDLLFLCAFDGFKHWIHYRELQINSAYRAQVDAYIKLNKLLHDSIEDALS